MKRLSRKPTRRTLIFALSVAALWLALSLPFSATRVAKATSEPISKSQSKAAPAAPTATFTVDRFDDTAAASACTAAANDCSLRGAIIKANTTAGTDTITVPAGTYTLTIAGGGEDAAATGDLDLTQSVIIQGAGAATTIIQAGTTSPVSSSTCADCIDRVFHIPAGGVTAEFNGLTIRHGSESFGAGIFNNFGDVTIANCILSNNLVQSAGGSGGGIYNVGTATITSCTLSNNRSAEGPGGGFYNGGTATVTNSTLSNNRSVVGAGIYNFDAMLDITNSTLSANSASNSGGGIDNDGAGNLTITNCTLSGNTAPGFSGGGIFNHGTATINNSTLSNNSAMVGGGIENFFNGTLTINNSTLSNNSSIEGGAIENGDGNPSPTSATLTINNSTLSGNSAGDGPGGGIFNLEGTARINNSTLSGNSAGNGGGIANLGPSEMIIKNSIVANSPSGGNCANTGFGATFTALGKNFDTDGTGAALDSDFMQVTPAQLNLGPLQNNGGPTQTHALLAGSVAIDAVTDCTRTDGTTPVTTDQRGESRPLDGDGNGSSLCDVGAFEAAQFFVVDRTDDVNPPATACTGAPNDCSLRGAVIKANTTPGTNTITVPPGTYTLTIAGQGEEAAATGDLDLTQSVIIQGAGAVTTIIQAGTTSPVSPSTCPSCIDRVFHVVSSGVTAEFNGLTIRHGLETVGGAAIWNAGTARIIACTVTDNRAANGGGIRNNSGTLEVTDCTLSGNSASGDGGGLYNIGTSTLTLTNSTLSGNGAGDDGGGIFNNAPATINSCTLSNNFGGGATPGGGGIFNSSTLTIKNSIVANSGAGGNCANPGGTFTALGKNFDTDGTGAALDPDFMQVTPAQLNLGPLQNNGGPTQTHALLTGSVAIDAVTDCTKADGATTVTTDQRAAPRPVDGDGNGSSLCDVGALEIATPTMITLVSFTGTAYDNGVLLEWKTGLEADNLGFNLYREARGRRALVNRQLVAGSALRASSVLLSGASYQWWDDARDGNAAYWLEDVDLNGNSTWHGPFYAKTVGGKPAAHTNAELLSDRGKAQSKAGGSVAVERVAALPLAGFQENTALATPGNQPTVKLRINHEGFYRVSAGDLFSAGLPQNLDPQNLQLFVGDREVPILVSTDSGVPFDATSFVEFYGFGLDTPATDTQIYWLTVGTQPGKRIPRMKPVSGPPSTAESFTHTIERKDRFIYFPGLRNGDAENFFGAVVTSSGVDQTLNVSHLAAKGNEAELEIALQGLTQQAHSILVQLNGNAVGVIDFDGQQRGVKRFAVSQSLLTEGNNTVRVSAQNGASDLSLVEVMRFSYAHRFEADHDVLKFTANGGEQVSVSGFTSKAIRVLDVTNSEGVTELSGDIQEARDGGYFVHVGIREKGERTLLALTDEQAKPAAEVRKEFLSDWHDSKNAADFLILTRRELFPAFEPLKTLRQSQGLKVALVDVEDLYDEFNYGVKSPQSLKDFLQYAGRSWKVKPRFVLLGGDASYDARNYLGYGDFDAMPTKMIDTNLMETASDDWLADFNNDGISDLAIGRLPARTLVEAEIMVNKIAVYQQSKPVDSALLVSDANDGYDFEQASDALKNLLPTTIRVEEIKRGKLDGATAKARLFEAINRGQKLINYTGHGNAGLWRGNLFSNEEAQALTNQRLAMFVLMTCLNGYFEDPEFDSLGEALVKAGQGGAVAVWASSGLTVADEQARVNRELYRLLFGAVSKFTIGEAVQRAKQVTTDADIRKTWILLGDPTMRLK